MAYKFGDFSLYVEWSWCTLWTKIDHQWNLGFVDGNERFF